MNPVTIGFLSEDVFCHWKCVFPVTMCFLSKECWSFSGGIWKKTHRGRDMLGKDLSQLMSSSAEVCRYMTISRYCLQCWYSLTHLSTYTAPIFLLVHTRLRSRSHDIISTRHVYQEIQVQYVAIAGPTEKFTWRYEKCVLSKDYTWSAGLYIEIPEYSINIDFDLRHT
jgi:hypothetical protein